MLLVLTLIIIGSFALGMFTGIFVMGLAHASSVTIVDHHYADPPASVRPCIRVRQPYDWEAVDERL